MKKQTQHTPTPWQVSHGATGGNIYPVNSHSHRTRIDYDFPSAITTEDYKQCQNNAEFIVKAVNCFDDLVEACKVALDYMLDEKSSDVTGAQALLIIKQALARAEGK